MPSLSDSLAALADYSAQIHTLSASNLAPAGQYTTAYLDSIHRNPAPPASGSGSGSKRAKPNSRASRGRGEAGVLGLIRDAQESEVRLFRFIGEAEVVGVGRVKKVEKRDEARAGGRAGMVSREEGEGRDEVEVMLRTALRLVDDYRPMPRARATIASLLETHHGQLERVAELELAIEEASSTQADTNPQPSVPSRSNSAPSTKPKLTFEEAIKAEEAALRSMEATLAPLRKARLATSSSAPPDPDHAAFQPSTTFPSSPPLPKAVPSRTPAKTPSSRDIHVTNSLVNGVTPRRHMTPARGAGGVLTEGFEFDRFSPLKFLGTPRAKARDTRSTLREVMGSPAPVREEAEGVVGRGIFGRPRVTSTGWEGTASVGEKSGDGEEDEDQTVRFTPGTVALPEEAVGSVEPEERQRDVGGLEQEQPVEVAVAEPDGVLEGVQYRLSTVQQAIDKIREGLSEMLRQGLPAGSDAPETVEDTISHLARLARSDPSPPPSPSSHSTSTLSSAPNPSGPPVPPITPQTILTAHLLLCLLRGEDAAVSMNELKDDLGAIARARGWESDAVGAGGGMITKCIYHVVGKRVAKIDRKSGAKVMFAI